MNTTTTSTEQLIREFAATGEPFLLGVIADSLDEQGKGKLARKCRKALNSSSRVGFFLAHATCSTPALKLSWSIQMAEAEEWFARLRGKGQAWSEWEQCDEEEDSGEWCCLLIAVVKGKEQAADSVPIPMLYGPGGDGFKVRLVEARLAYELKQRWA